ncbi:hypothetical protein BN2497_3231 [Janthinobacterium sp. CG23_2]|nr:hypothetical protein BN2497_3231 [Janthinobacterium sp. CG23_2]CUU28013.1 hypothetical protein BN3177_3231 [Janthinobacterium sp. CG23_2]
MNSFILITIIASIHDAKAPIIYAKQHFTSSLISFYVISIKWWPSHHAAFS